MIGYHLEGNMKARGYISISLLLFLPILFLLITTYYIDRNHVVFVIANTSAHEYSDRSVIIAMTGSSVSLSDISFRKKRTTETWKKMIKIRKSNIINRPLSDKRLLFFSYLSSSSINQAQQFQISKAYFPRSIILDRSLSFLQYQDQRRFQNFQYTVKYNSNSDIPTSGKNNNNNNNGSGNSDNLNPYSVIKRNLYLKTRPKPYQGLRSRMDKEFAVLLMRSSYNVADELDFVPMDQFQKEFFFIRQNEWEDYYNSFPKLGLIQGDLTDPKYFDFISYAQYLTLDQEMKNGKQIFEELVNANGESQIVRRNPLYSDNTLLPIEHSKRVGNRILDYMLERPANIAPVIEKEGTIDSLFDNIQRILDIFLITRYFNNNATLVPITANKSQFVVRVDTPANIWSHKLLSTFDKTKLQNDFECKAILAYLYRCGYEKSRYTTTFTKGSLIEYTFEIK